MHKVPSSPHVGLTLGFGDSITSGTGATDAAHRWLNIVAATMSGGVLQNSGIASTTLQNTVQNEVATIGGPVDNNGRDTYHTRVSDYVVAGDYVFILYGVNDIMINDAALTPAAFQNDLGEVVDGIIADTGMAAANITIGSPPYITTAGYASPHPYDGGTLAKHLLYSAACSAVAAAKGCKYVDVRQRMADNGGDALSSDGVHPNDAGHRQIAYAFLSAWGIMPNTDAVVSVLVSSFPTSNFGTSISLLTKAFGAATGLLKFDFSSIPATAICTSAILTMYQSSSGGSTAWTVTVNSIAAANAAWIAGTKNGTQADAGEPCWNARLADGAGGVTAAWAGTAGLGTSGVDYEAAAIGSFSGMSNDANGTRYDCALDIARVQGWFGSPNTNYGLCLTSPAASIGGLASVNHSTIAWHPVLTVMWTMPSTRTHYLDMVLGRKKHLCYTGY